MIRSLPLTADIGEAETIAGADGRWVSLDISGITIFSEFVYDTNWEGNRTHEMALENCLRVFAQRLTRALESDD